jgi:predicted dehydrogenase
MPAAPPYGVLLVSGGMTHQENYGPGFSADPRARIVAVSDVDGVSGRRKELNREFAAQMGVPVIDSLDEALARDDVHLVSVCAAFEPRARAAAKCAAAGKHVYLDKPLATNMPDAERLVEAVRRAGVHNQMFTQIGQPYAQKAMRIVRGGTLGELRAIHCDLMFAKGYPGGAPLGPARKEHYPPRQFTFPDAKREVWTTAVYSLTLIRWLASGRNFRSVYAATANYFFEEHHRHDVEDWGMLSVTLDGGLTATISAGRIGWQSHRGSGPNYLRLFGTKGSVMIDNHAPRFEIASDRLEWSPPARDPFDPMGFWKSTQDRGGVKPRPDWHAPGTIEPLSDQAMFLDAIEQEREAEVTVVDGAAATEVMLGAYQSAATGKRVELPLAR